MAGLDLRDPFSRWIASSLCQRCLQFVYGSRNWAYFIHPKYFYLLLLPSTSILNLRLVLKSTFAWSTLLNLPLLLDWTSYRLASLLLGISEVSRTQLLRHLIKDLIFCLDFFLSKFLSASLMHFDITSCLHNSVYSLDFPLNIDIWSFWGKTFHLHLLKFPKFSFEKDREHLSIHHQKQLSATLYFSWQ